MLTEWLLGRNSEVVRDRRLQLLLGANLIAVLEIALVSPILDTLTGVFEVTTSEVGLLVTAIAVPAIVLIPVGGALTDRYGRKPVLTGGLLLYGGAGAAIAFTLDFRVALALRVIQGVGFSGTVPVIVTSFRDLYGESREATAQGLRITVGGISQAIFPALAGVLVTIRWQYPFLLYSLAIPAALLVYWRLDEPTAGNAPDRGLKANPGEVRGYGYNLVALTVRRQVAAILLAQMISAVVIFAFFTYNSLIVVRVLEGSPRLAGVLVAMFSLVYAGIATQAGRLTELVENRNWLLFGANVSLGIGLIAFSVAPSVEVAGVSVVLLGIGTGITFPLYRSLITGFAPEDLRGGLVSIGEALMRVSAALTPAVLGGVIATVETTAGTAVALKWTLAITGGAAGAIGVLCVLIVALNGTE